MTPADLVKLLHVFAGADGGCHYCAGDQLHEAVRCFPDWPWTEALQLFSPSGFEEADLRQFGATLKVTPKATV